ncbi:hypothetical protein GOP47_0003238 [Adiantum capillus-veneris]|uniref:Uncharacterized protein n=1 Tax=Adiantum capillus-veneris TaxID=13818 RepID=A0A9D4VCF7_ADICA|nr:hypothetical protein GOP47_0003238 [Adiantum capillus-veneris]
MKVEGITCFLTLLLVTMMSMQATLKLVHANGPYNLREDGGSIVGGQLLSAPAANASSNSSSSNATTAPSSTTTSKPNSTAAFNSSNLHSRARRGPIGSNCC